MLMSVKTKRRKLKKTPLFLMLALTLILSVFLVPWTSLYDRLTIPGYEHLLAIGYSRNEITALAKALDGKQLEALLELPYAQDNLERLTVDDYATLRDKGYSRDLVLTVLEGDTALRDVVLEQDSIPELEAWLKLENLAPSRFARMLAYAKTHPNLSLEKIASRVNADRDRPLYADIQSADLTRGNLLLVNKYFALPADYVPKDLTKVPDCGGDFVMVKEAAEALGTMCRAMQEAKIDVLISNTYRSYVSQTTIYNRYLKKDPQAVVDRFSARPGHSEHQAGLAVDLRTSKSDITGFEGSPADRWLKENAPRYGFIQRYREGQEDLTGYQTESWHYRYVGIEAAQRIFEKGWTLEEYLALNP